MLYLDDWIIWDFWLAPRLDADEPFHCYFLQAPRSIADPELRHNLARIGQATSPDLVTWTYLGEALPLGGPGAWDDMTHWTGSVVRDRGKAWMFYTGRSRSESGNVQRVGVAVSDDLITWEKVDGNPVVEAEAPWYCAPAADGTVRSDCRDPWVIQHDGQWLMYYTASAAGQPEESRGVVGLATSTDLLSWTAEPPVAGPGQFAEIEVPQVFPLGEEWAMLFCTSKHATIDGLTATWNGTHYCLGSSPYGPFRMAPEPWLQADLTGTNYAARVVFDPWLGNLLLAWKRLDADGNFVGALTDPVPLELDPANGRIRLLGA